MVPDLTRAMDKLGTKIPDAFSDAMDSMTGENPEEKEERRQWERTSVEVNSMQARGLGFGATYVDPVEKKKVSLLEEIKQVLSRAESGGELRWT
jgi:gamma-glutamyl:cysteine ligase YbdK (ATP-grasp superfamily)